MFEDTGVPKERVDWFNYRLYVEKSYLTLGDLHSAIAAGPEYPTYKNIDTPQYREHTLSYLKRLLEQGKLKVGGIDVLHPDEKGICHFREIKGTPDEIIQKIREEWEEAARQAKEQNNRAILAGFEYCVWFTLPENEWPKFEKSESQDENKE
jgi:hypothetical protein